MWPTPYSILDQRAIPVKQFPHFADPATDIVLKPKGRFPSLICL